MHDYDIFIHSIDIGLTIWSQGNPLLNMNTEGNIHIHAATLLIVSLWWKWSNLENLPFSFHIWSQIEDIMCINGFWKFTKTISIFDLYRSSKPRPKYKLKFGLNLWHGDVTDDVLSV